MITRRTFVSTAASVLGMSIIGLCGCVSTQDNRVVVYSSAEGERNELLLSRIREDLPQLDIRLHYMSTGNLAARLAVEKANIECDIIVGLEASYMMATEDALTPLNTMYDMNVFVPDLQISNKIMPFSRESGCFAYNKDVLAAKGIEPPQTLEDLTDSRFEGLISIPDPRSSSTGYNFLYSMVNLLGEDAAFDYFKKLSKNVYQFTTSGSAPAKALTQGEAGVGLSLIFQFVVEQKKGAPIKLVMFKEGCPWTMVGTGIISGHESKPGVKQAMDWIYSIGILLDKESFVPDQIFVDQNVTLDGYPQDITYANMTGLFNLETKERLLDKWNF